MPYYHSILYHSSRRRSNQKCRQRAQCYCCPPDLRQVERALLGTVHHPHAGHSVGVGDNLLVGTTGECTELVSIWSTPIATVCGCIQRLAWVAAGQVGITGIFTVPVIKMAVIERTGEDSGTRTVIIRLAQVARSPDKVGKEYLVIVGTALRPGRCRPGRHLFRT